MTCSILTWNVRGLGKAEKLRALCHVIISTRANVVFIQETKLESIKPCVKTRFQRCKLGELATAPSVGASGGLISVWDPKFFNVEDTIVLGRIVGLTGTIVHRNLKVGFLNIYAPNDISERIKEELSSNN
ncbi:hypothetical protein HRI_004014100 [Hibiscus trionum]|uniref:Endonuclease/exonuclease/phosphatase domain-containing protein n=1 Tax=Hibiscus trionum TaxID=183268 RepID=A0A9W7J0Z1_HIBTR|nr:hypothetical protein HRI_004014100 [Hibiscus trionum]